MKKLIKLIALVVILSFATQSYAQTFGIQAGLNLSNIHSKDDDRTYSDDWKSKAGFNVGLTADFALNGFLSVETGLIFETKGYKTDEVSGLSSKLNAFYIDIPIALKAGIDIGGLRIYAKVGPYVGFGLFGKQIVKYNSTTNKEDIQWGNGDNDDMKRLDFGGLAGAGLEFGNFQLGLAYNLGLISISPETNNGAKAQNRVFSVSLGYKFGGSGR